MFKKILFPTDFSEYSIKTMEYVWSLKDIGVEKVVLLHIVHSIEEYPVMLAHQEKVRSLLEEEAAKLREHGLEVETRVQAGTVYRQILNVAEDEDVSMIVIGCHGESFHGVVIGSVSDRVIRESSVPVLLVKYRIINDKNGKRLEKVSPELFKKVFYPTDFSLCATGTLEYVREFRKVGCKEVILGSVIDTRPHRSGFDAEQAQRETEKKLDVTKKELEERGLKVNVIVRQGTPLKEILDIAETEDVSMIIIGSTGKGFFKEMLLGSVSESVIRKAKCPVLVIHDEICKITIE